MVKTVNIRCATENDKASWNQFASRFTDNPFHLYQWKEVLERVYGYDFRYLVAEDSEGIAGIFPVAVLKSRLFGTRICSIPFADYGGPLIELSKQSASILNSFLKHLSEFVANALFLEVRSPVQPQVTAWLEKNLKHAPVRYVTFVVKLGSFEDVWGGTFHQKRRTAIRKAIRNGIRITEGDFESDLIEFYRAYLLSMKRLGSPPHSIVFFRTCYELLGGRTVKLFLATAMKRVIGGAIAFLGEHTIYAAYEGIDPKYRHLNAGALTDCEIMKWGCKNKYFYYNFGRTLHNSGVYYYKKQWGGTEVAMPYYYLGNQIPNKDPREKYECLSGLWSRVVPLSIARKIGPIIKGAIGY